MAMQLAKLKFGTVMNFFTSLDRNTTATDIYKRCGITFSHIYHLVLALEKSGLLFKKKDGRRKPIALTDSGRKFKRGMMLAREALEDVDENKD